jgi:hypothetical protein
MNKRAGIVCDNYKVETFKKVIKDNGYTLLNELKSTGKTKLLEVEFKEEQRHDLMILIKRTEASFQNRN